MKKILAVSGGVDSVVMLDIAVGRYSPDDIIVAHFDHGIRNNSKDDAKFVQDLSKNYNVRFVQEKAELGENAPEALARQKRYNFLEKIAKNYNGTIWTAHHLDDLIETIAINLVRGTGWRGCSALDRENIYRPFLDEGFIKGIFNDLPTKNDIYKYAANQDLCFREDPTNNSEQYLRNRLRAQLDNFPNEKKLTIYNIWLHQKKLKKEIENIISEIVPTSAWQRNWFKNLDPEVAMEILRTALLKCGISATRPQIANFLNAIITYEPGKYFNLPNDNLVRINKNNFEL